MRDDTRHDLLALDIRDLTHSVGTRKRRRKQHYNWGTTLALFLALAALLYFGLRAYASPSQMVGTSRSISL